MELGTTGEIGFRSPEWRNHFVSFLEPAFIRCLFVSLLEPAITRYIFKWPRFTVAQEYIKDFQWNLSSIMHTSNSISSYPWRAHSSQFSHFLSLPVSPNLPCYYLLKRTKGSINLFNAKISGTLNKKNPSKLPIWYIPSIKKCSKVRVIFPTGKTPVCTQV